MENKVLVLQDIVDALAKETNLPADVCQSFVKELFAFVEDKLVADGAVSLRGIGRFAVVEGDVRFEADADVAASVNSAFDCFEPIELADDFDAGEEGSEPAPAEEPATQKEEEKAEPEEKEEPVEEPEEKPADEPETESSEQLPPPVENVDTPVNLPIPDPEGEEEQESEQEEGDEPTDEIPEEEMRTRSFGFFWGFVTGFLVAALIAAAAYYFFFVTPRVAETKPQPAVADSTVVAETTDSTAAPEVAEKPAVEVKEEPQQKEQTYTVTSTAYLSNISRKFYGHYAFWVYIYLENKDVIKDPDNLPVGAELKIPAPEKYGIDKDDPESIRRAEIKALEVKNGEQ